MSATENILILTIVLKNYLKTLLQINKPEKNNI